MHLAIGRMHDFCQAFDKVNPVSLGADRTERHVTLVFSSILVTGDPSPEIPGLAGGGLVARDW